MAYQQGISVVAFPQDVERITAAFHESYEQIAEAIGYKTREAPRVAWDDVPEQNKAVMCATVKTLIARGIITPGEGPVTAALQQLMDDVERDRREPDKILCHLASARRRLFDAQTPAPERYDEQ